MPSLKGHTWFERRWLLLVLLALSFRAAYIEWPIAGSRPDDAPGHWYIVTPDSHSYLDPIENQLQGGSYYPDYRMPGVGAPYWLFRQFLDIPASRDALVVLQWFLSGLSVYLLGLVALRLTDSHRTALATYGLFLFSTFTSWHDTSMSSDSLATSAIIIQVYLFQQAFDRSSKWLLACAGFFLTWVIFLRPVAALLLIPAAALVFYQWGKARSWKPLVIFLMPFMLIESFWVIRNWRANQEFNPLTNQGVMPDEIADRPLGYLMRFLQGYGGNYIWWEAGADIRWFGLWHGSAALDDEGRNADPPPSYAYAPGYDQDSLLVVSELIRTALHGGMEQTDSIAYLARANAALERYTEQHAEHAPFTHHVTSRFLMIRHMVIQKGAETLFGRFYHTLPAWMKLFKLCQMALYMFVTAFGIWAGIVMLWRWREATSVLSIWLPVVALYMVFVYPLVLKMAEGRFMVHVFPILLVLAVSYTMDLITRIRGAAKQP